MKKTAWLSKKLDSGKVLYQACAHAYKLDDNDNESTYCPNCKTKVIDRSGNIGQFVVNHLDENGTCPICGYKLEGIWHK